MPGSPRLGAHPYFAIPVKPCANTAAEPDAALVGLLKKAADFQQYMFANRSKSVGELAKEKGVGPNFFARMIRLNYLAPDIQASIYDGTQPPEVTRQRILFGSMPLDWEQQRQLMGY